MATSAFVVTLEQNLIGGLQEQHFHIQVARPKFGQRDGKLVQFVDEIARVHPHRHRRRRDIARGQDFPRQRQDQLERQIVDAVIIQVFQRLQGDGLAGAGQPADDDYSHGAASAIAFSMRAIKSSSAR